MNNTGKHHLKHLLACSLVLLGCSLQQVRADTLDTIAVVVNEDIITQSEIQQRVRLLLASNGKLASASAAQLQEAARDDLVLEKLQLQYAKANNLTVDDTTVDIAMERIAGQNQMNLPTFQAALQKQGINYLQFREQTRNRMVVERLRQTQGRDTVSVTSAEIQEAVAGSDLMRGRRYRFEHLLIPAPNGSSVAQINAARQQAQTLRRRIIAGESFAALAAALPQVSSQHDYTGWQTDSSLPGEFLRALSLLETGELADVIQDSEGFHLIKLTEQTAGSNEQQSAATANAEALRNQASNALGERKLDAYYRIWLQGLRNSAFISVPGQNTSTPAPTPQ